MASKSVVNQNGAGAGGRLAGADAARRAKAHLEELTGGRCEAVSGLARTDAGWSVTLEMLELERLAAALAGGPVVPFRFGTVVRSDEDVRQVLDRHYDALAGLLDSLRGKQEWGVKVVRRSAVRVEAGADEANGTAYLRGRQRERAGRADTTRRDSAAGGRCHDRLQELAADAAVLPPRAAAARGPPVVFNGAYLVNEADAGRFRALVDDLAGEYEPGGLSVEATGPWPAYTFARLDLVPEAAP